MIAYFDMFSGVAGDMILGSLLDAGLERAVLRESLAGLPIPPFELEVSRVRRGALTATLAAWSFTDSATHRSLPEIERIIRGAALPSHVEEKSLAIFRRLAAAEGAVHGVPADEVHFHEAGALDAILDVCGAVSALNLLGVDRVEASAFRTGGGYVQTDHGRLPVPAPAVSALIEGWRIEPLESPAELTTPTGAAIVTTLAKPPGGAPGLVARRTGYGAGSRDTGDPPNCLRVMLGDPLTTDSTSRGFGQEELVMLETNIDDMNPQLYGWLEERLFDAGAREVFFTAVGMKKGRPGTLVSCLAQERAVEELTEILFRETTTLGVRAWPVRRRFLPRRETYAVTSLGRVRVKRVRGTGGHEETRPEYDECRRLAAELGLPLREVLERLTRELADGDSASEPSDRKATREPAPGDSTARSREVAEPRRNE